MNLIQFFLAARANLIKVDNRECEVALDLEQKKYLVSEMKSVGIEQRFVQIKECFKENIFDLRQRKEK